MRIPPLFLRQNGRIRWIPTIIASFLVFSVIMTIIVAVELAQDTNVRVWEHHSLGSPAAYMEIRMQITRLETSNNSMQVHYKFVPHGSLASASLAKTPFPEKSVVMYLDDVVTTAKKGKPLSTRDAFYSFDVATVSRYPYDSYHADLAFYAHELENEGINVPTKLKIENKMHGWRLLVSFGDDPTLQSQTATIHLIRKPSIKVFSMFITVVMWLLSTTMFTIACSIWLRGKTAPPALIGASAGLMFALPAVRSAQPGIPPIGIILDMYGFFWNMLLVACANLLISWNFLVTSGRPGQKLRAHEEQGLISQQTKPDNLK